MYVDWTKISLVYLIVRLLNVANELSQILDVESIADGQMMIALAHRVIMLSVSVEDFY